MVEGSSPLRVLVVCTANVCRSPMGEALFSHHLRRSGAQVHVSSAGTRAGSLSLPADPLAIDALAGLGVHLDGHVPRQVTSDMIGEDGADLILTMTREHLRDIATTVRGVFPRTFTLRELARRSMSAGPYRSGDVAGWLELVGSGRRVADLMGADPDDDVSDPYGLGAAAVRRTAAEIDDLVQTLVRLGPWTTGGRPTS